jgi:hypothetical protein
LERFGGNVSLFNNGKLLERIVMWDVGGDVDRINSIMEYNDKVVECCEEKLMLTLVFRIVSWRRVVIRGLLLIFLEDIVISLE